MESFPACSSKTLDTHFPTDLLQNLSLFSCCFKTHLTHCWVCFIIFREYAQKIYFPNIRRQVFIESLHVFLIIIAFLLFLFSNRWHFCFQYSFKVSDILSSLVYLFFFFFLSDSLCQFSTIISSWFIIVIISFLLYHLFFVLK